MKHFYLSLLLCLPLTAQTLSEQEGVGTRTYELFDANRERPITLELWYPIDAEIPVTPAADFFWIRAKEARNAPFSKQKASYPLLLFSHGFGANRLSSSWIAESLAKAGCIVAAVDHYGNTMDTLLPLESFSPWEKAIDLSFTLDFLLEHFPESIQTDQIGAIGFSQGGAVCLWLAGAKADFTPIIPSLPEIGAESFPPDELEEALAQIDFSKGEKSFRDERIKAAFLMAPTLGSNFSLFTESSLSQIKIPVTIAIVGNDPIAPKEKNALFFAHYIPNCTCHTIVGEGSHFLFLNSGTEPAKKIAPRFLIDEPQAKREEFHPDVVKLAKEFFSLTEN